MNATGDRAALRERLLLEARAAASVTHPAIVKIYDVGETAFGDPFIVMELLHGASLGSILQTEGRLSAVRAIQTLLPIAEALQLAHTRGLVHRDVKPDNIFILHDEGTIQPKLVDFGIVKTTQQDSNTHLTRAGDVIGSPDYLSPEQARGQSDVDHLSDVWAFSVVLYEAITGRVPFNATNYNALVRQIIEDEPPPLEKLAVVNQELSAIVSRGLSKDRRGRYSSMAEMGRALAGWLHEQGELHDLCGTSLERRWLQSGDADGVIWQPEPRSRITAHGREATSKPTQRRATRAPSRGRIAALALVLAAFGFAVVAWHNGFFEERPGARNAAATVRATEANEPETPAGSKAVPSPSAVETASSAAPESAARESTAPDVSDGASPSSSATRQRPAATGRRRKAQPPAQVPAVPHPRGDLIKPYEE
jgi:serine/threonine-protein kinase